MKDGPPMGTPAIIGTVMELSAPDPFIHHK